MCDIERLFSEEYEESLSDSVFVMLLFVSFMLREVGEVIEMYGREGWLGFIDEKKYYVYNF